MSYSPLILLYKMGLREVISIQMLLQFMFEAPNPLVEINAHQATL